MTIWVGIGATGVNVYVNNIGCTDFRAPIGYTDDTYNTSPQSL